MHEPLLDIEAPDVRSRERHRFIQRFATTSLGTNVHRWAMMVQEFLRFWWEVTTDSEFLRSRISRRQSLRLALPAMAIGVFVVDSYSTIVDDAGQWWWMWPDVAMLLMSCWYCLYSTGPGSMHVDAVIAVFMTASSCFWWASIDADADAEHNCKAVDITSLVWIPGSMVGTASVGVHSLVLICFWIISIAWTRGSASGPPWQTIIITTLITVCSVAVELCLASLYRDWQIQQGCNQNLLEGATDGFGVVDSSTGVVLEASPKMLQTLDARSLVGKQLQSGILENSQAEVLSAFHGTAGASPAPVLITWTSELLECEVRLVPYKLLGSHIGFSVQRVGEARSRMTPCAVQAEESEGPVEEREGRATRTHKPCRKAARGGRAGTGTAMCTSGRERDVPMADWEQGEEVFNRTTPPQAVDDMQSTEGDGPGPTRSAVVHPDLGKKRWAAKRSGAKSQSSRSQETFSLSSWTASNPSNAPRSQTQNQRKRKVITQTVAVQAGGRRPPAPLTACTFPSFLQAKAARKAQLARRSAAVVEEGRPRVPVFLATPQATRLHGLQTVASSSNVTGEGCCQKHITWMGLQNLISEIMLERCSDFRCFSGWQCPQCLSVHDYEDGSDMDEEEKRDLQLCFFCLDAVEPILPKEQWRRVELEEQTLAAVATSEVAAARPAEEGVSEQVSEGSIAEGSVYDADFEVEEGDLQQGSESDASRQTQIGAS